MVDIKILATICSLVSPSSCHEVIVTNSDVADISIASCSVGVPQLAEWITKEHPGFRLGGWRCEIGGREKRGA